MLSPTLEYVHAGLDLEKEDLLYNKNEYNNE